MSQKKPPHDDPAPRADDQTRDPHAPNGGLNEEIGELDPDAPEDDDALPGKAGGGLAGG